MNTRDGVEGAGAVGPTTSGWHSAAPQHREQLQPENVTWKGKSKAKPSQPCAPGGGRGTPEPGAGGEGRALWGRPAGPPALPQPPVGS